MDGDQWEDEEDVEDGEDGSEEEDETDDVQHGPDEGSWSGSEMESDDEDGEDEWHGFIAEGGTEGDVPLDTLDPPAAAAGEYGSHSTRLELISR